MLADYMIYCWLDADGEIEEWVLVDMLAVAGMDLSQYVTIANRDKRNGFKAIPIANLKSSILAGEKTSDYRRSCNNAAPEGD
ncbi:MAG: hypothetical protein HC892_00305 [Saprospiraceae bacterium]|nr:hypothetical protein [Saprospiraceae bacterium]